MIGGINIDKRTEAVGFIVKTVREFFGDSSVKVNEAVMKLLDTVTVRYLVGPPGGSKHHHGFRDGLVIHTAEVLKASLAIGRVLEIRDLRPLVVAAILHDAGKMYDYCFDSDGNVQRVSGYQIGNHIVASYDIWTRWLATQNMHYEGWWDDVGRAILTHHGRREWGSGIEPSTPVEWALHLADMASAMVGVPL